MIKPPSISINPKPIKVSHIYKILPVICGLSYPRSGDFQKTIFAPSVYKETPNYDRVLKAPSILINPKAKGIES